MDGKGPRDVKAVEQLFRRPVQARRHLGDQKGIKGVGRVDEDDMLPSRKQRGDRLQSIGEDNLIAIEQDEPTPRPPSVEGAGELRRDERGREHTLHDYSFRKTPMTLPRIRNGCSGVILIGAKSSFSGMRTIVCRLSGSA